MAIMLTLIDSSQSVVNSLHVFLRCVTVQSCRLHSVADIHPLWTSSPGCMRILYPPHSSPITEIV